MRELRRFEEAEAATQAALARFPDDIGLRIDLARLAQAARDLPAAIDRWAAIRAMRPDMLEAWVQAARAMQESWRHEEADALLCDAMLRFPDAPEPAVQYAWMAFDVNRWDDAELRFRHLRERFPALSDGWQGGSAVLRNQFKLDEAAAMLEDGMERFPDLPQFMLEYARLPIARPFAAEKDWPETLRRLARVHERFPEFETGFIEGVRLLQQYGEPDRAEALAQSAGQRLPNSYALAIQYAEAAETRADWPAAITRYTTVKERFPDQPGGDVGLARTLSRESRFDEADTLLLNTMERFPAHPSPFAEYADLAMRRENWAEALKRWTAAVDRFPNEREYAHRKYEAQMRLADADPASSAAMSFLVPAPMPDPDATDRQVSALAMQFESLGGRGLGCEFGIFQRDCGAEPLGLLRWADMPYDMLVETLRNRFAGVGTEEYTELFLNAIGGGRGEYCTRDLRGMMFQRSFVYEDQTTRDKMLVSVIKRLQFLTRKLIADLEEGTKIFVFRLTDRNLTDDEIADLHAAMRAYGDNWLLYVRYEDADHPNGTVELVAPGLMIGYMDRFKLSATNQLSAAPPTASWLTVCRNAYAIWKGGDA